MNITKLRKRQIKKKKELNDLSNKFKELKSLIYDYRDTKEYEIEKLNLDHENLKQEIDDNQKKYENLIDEDADQISNFVRLDFFQDESEKIVSMVNDLENNVILATLIVFLVIYSFMGKKSSILVSLSIPSSFF